MSRYIKQALEQQTKELEQWKKILKPEFFKELEWRVTINNENAFDEYDIIKGDKMLKIVHRTILNLEK
jgi:N-acyl-L-homoserine lactone synthetase